MTPINLWVAADAVYAGEVDDRLLHAGWRALSADLGSWFGRDAQRLVQRLAGLKAAGK